MGKLLNHNGVSQAASIADLRRATCTLLQGARCSETHQRIWAVGRLAASSSTGRANLNHRRYRPQRGYARDGLTIGATVARAG